MRDYVFTVGRDGCGTWEISVGGCESQEEARAFLLSVCDWSLASHFWIEAVREVVR